MLYLVHETKVALVNFKGWQEWQAIDPYRVARNCLAHNGGTVVAEHENLAALVAEMSDEEVLSLREQFGELELLRTVAAFRR